MGDDSVDGGGVGGAVSGGRNGCVVDNVCDEDDRDDGVSGGKGSAKLLSEII